MGSAAGESEKWLRDSVGAAAKTAPAILFIDEIDSIAPKRGQVQGEAEKRLVAQLLTLMDGLEPRTNLVVIAATNRPDAFDEALRSEEHTSELQSLMRTSYAVFCLKKKKIQLHATTHTNKLSSHDLMTNISDISITLNTANQ